MMRALFAALVVIVGAIGAVAYFALFIVHVNEQAIVLEFGKPVRIISEPGLYLEDSRGADRRLFRQAHPRSRHRRRRR